MYAGAPPLAMKIRRLEFTGVACGYPQDPAPFADAVHHSCAGVRLRPLILLQQLIPLVKRPVYTGRLPRLEQERLEQHPAFVTPETTVDVHC